MDETKKTLLIAVIALMLFGVMTCTIISDTHQKLVRAREDNDYYTSHYQRKAGATTVWKDKYLSYDLRTLDGGKNWYAVQKTNNDEIVIIGNVKTVYPGLLETLDAWDKLVNYAEKNGPINLGNSDTIDKLKNMGFTFTPKTN